MTGRAGSTIFRPNVFRQGAGWLLLIWGSIVLCVVPPNLRLWTQSTPDPQELTLREVLDGKGRDNPHVAVTKFHLCGQYVTRNYKGRGLQWMGFIGIVPAPVEGGKADPFATPRLIVRPRNSIEESRLVTVWGRQRSLTGILGPPDRLSGPDREDLQKVYPGIDLSSCLVLEEGRQPLSAGALAGWTGAGAAAVAFGLILLLPGWLRRFRGRSGES